MAKKEMTPALRRYKQLEREAWQALAKLQQIQEAILNGVTELDEDDNPIYPDNVVQFKRDK